MLLLYAASLKQAAQRCFTDLKRFHPVHRHCAVVQAGSFTIKAIRVTGFMQSAEVKML